MLSVQDTIVLVYSEVDKNVPPVPVHEQLLYNISDDFAKRISNGRAAIEAQEIENATHFDISVPLAHRACIFVGRCAYGQPMWDPDDAQSPEDDLKSLVELYVLANDKETRHAKELVDACVSSMLQILLESRDGLHNPLASLRPVFYVMEAIDGDESAKTKIMKMLVHGACAKDGSTGAWLRTYRGSSHHTNEGLGEDFLVDLCAQLADKVTEKAKSCLGKRQRPSQVEGSSPAKR